MKVFWLSSPVKERDIPMYRIGNELTNISKFSLKEKSPFNFLMIANPIESSCICTLHDIKLNAHDIGTVRFFMADDFSIMGKLKQADVFQYGCMATGILPLNRIELFTVHSFQNSDIDLFQKHYSILLPGGGLLLELGKAITEADLIVHWSKEDF